MQPVLEARGINKHFGPVQALKDVDLSVFPGEVVALIGDNGAGKSTLINVMTGVLPLERARSCSGGNTCDSRLHTRRERMGSRPSTRISRLRPIWMRWPTFSWAGNDGRADCWESIGFLDNRRMRKETDEQLSRLRVQVPDLERRLVTLSGGQRQGVAVARAVMWASKVVIMDEPTAALGVAQTAKVLDLIRQVRDTGIPVVFISHNMPNVFQVADRIVVLRLGQVVTELDPKTATIEDAVAAMTGSTRFANREVD